MGSSVKSDIEALLATGGSMSGSFSTSARPRAGSLTGGSFRRRSFSFGTGGGGALTPPSQHTTTTTSAPPSRAPPLSAPAACAPAATRQKRRGSLTFLLGSQDLPATAPDSAPDTMHGIDTVASAGPSDGDSSSSSDLIQPSFSFGVPSVLDTLYGEGSNNNSLSGSLTPAQINHADENMWDNLGEAFLHAQTTTETSKSATIDHHHHHQSQSAASNTRRDSQNLSKIARLPPPRAWHGLVLGQFEGLSSFSGSIKSFVVHHGNSMRPVLCLPLAGDFAGVGECCAGSSAAQSNVRWVAAAPPADGLLIERGRALSLGPVLEQSVNALEIRFVVAFSGPTLLVNQRSNNSSSRKLKKTASSSSSSDEPLLDPPPATLATVESARGVKLKMRIHEDMFGRPAHGFVTVRVVDPSHELPQELVVGFRCGSDLFDCRSHLLCVRVVDMAERRVELSVDNVRVHPCYGECGSLMPLFVVAADAFPSSRQSSSANNLLSADGDSLSLIIVGSSKLSAAAVSSAAAAASSSSAAVSPFSVSPASVGLASAPLSPTAAAAAAAALPNQQAASVDDGDEDDTDEDETVVCVLRKFELHRILVHRSSSSSNNSAASVFPLHPQRRRRSSSTTTFTAPTAAAPSVTTRCIAKFHLDAGYGTIAKNLCATDDSNISNIKENGEEEGEKTEQHRQYHATLTNAAWMPTMIFKAQALAAAEGGDKGERAESLGQTAVVDTSSSNRLCVLSDEVVGTHSEQKRATTTTTTTRHRARGHRHGSSTSLPAAGYSIVFSALPAALCKQKNILRRESSNNNSNSESDLKLSCSRWENEPRRPNGVDFQHQQPFGSAAVRRSAVTGLVDMGDRMFEARDPAANPRGGWVAASRCSRRDGTDDDDKKDDEDEEHVLVVNFSQPQVVAEMYFVVRHGTFPVIDVFLSLDIAAKTQQRQQQIEEEQQQEQHQQHQPLEPLHSLMSHCATIRFGPSHPNCGSVTFDSPYHRVRSVKLVLRPANKKSVLARQHQHMVALDDWCIFADAISTSSSSALFSASSRAAICSFSARSKSEIETSPVRIRSFLSATAERQFPRNEEARQQRQWLQLRVSGSEDNLTLSERPDDGDDELDNNNRVRPMEQQRDHDDTNQEQQQQQGNRRHHKDSGHDEQTEDDDARRLKTAERQQREEERCARRDARDLAFEQLLGGSALLNSARLRHQVDVARKMDHESRKSDVSAPAAHHRVFVRELDRDERVRRAALELFDRIATPSASEMDISSGSGHDHRRNNHHHHHQQRQQVSPRPVRSAARDRCSLEDAASAIKETDLIDRWSLDQIREEFCKMHLIMSEKTASAGAALWEAAVLVVEKDNQSHPDHAAVRRRRDLAVRQALRRQVKSLQISREEFVRVYSCLFK